MKIAQFAVLVCLTGTILACGQKGPLVMPDQQKHKRVIPTLPPAKPANGSAAPAPAGASPSVPAAPASTPATEPANTPENSPANESPASTPAPPASTPQP
jgi:predicted small lipoprotein YifL